VARALQKILEMPLAKRSVALAYGSLDYLKAFKMLTNFAICLETSEMSGKLSLRLAIMG